MTTTRFPEAKRPEALTYFRSRRAAGMSVRRAYWQTVLACGYVGYTLPALSALSVVR